MEVSYSNLQRGDCLGVTGYNFYDVYGKPEGHTITLGTTWVRSSGVPFVTFLTGAYFQSKNLPLHHLKPGMYDSDKLFICTLRLNREVEVCNHANCN